MKEYRLVDTNNFGGDYPDEKWACIGTFNMESKANTVREAMARMLDYDEHCSRHLKVVELPYKLVGGFGEREFGMKMLPKAYEENHDLLCECVHIACQHLQTRDDCYELVKTLEQIKQDIKDFNS